MLDSLTLDELAMGILPTGTRRRNPRRDRPVPRWAEYYVDLRARDVDQPSAAMFSAGVLAHRWGMDSVLRHGRLLREVLERREAR
jgi:hypothetical protein